MMFIILKIGSFPIRIFETIRFLSCLPIFMMIIDKTLLMQRSRPRSLQEARQRYANYY